MSQQRLNNVSVCHVHQLSLDRVDLKDTGQQFVSVHDRRRLQLRQQKLMQTCLGNTAKWENEPNSFVMLAVKYTAT